MGQFSFLDCVTQEQVINNKERDVYVLVPMMYGGGTIKESCYDGYGHFGQYDIYDLIADWNKSFIPDILRYIEKGTWRCQANSNDVRNLKAFYRGESIECEKRWIGIMMACFDEDNERLMYPVKITHYPEKGTYEMMGISANDPDQGWYEPDMKDEDGTQDPNQGWYEPDMKDEDGTQDQDDQWVLLDEDNYQLCKTLIADEEDPVFEFYQLQESLDDPQEYLIAHQVIWWHEVDQQEVLEAYGYKDLAEVCALHGDSYRKILAACKFEMDAGQYANILTWNALDYETACDLMDRIIGR